MRCPQCREENPDRAKFCLNCGARLVLACPQCGTELSPAAKFCSECGAALALAPTPPAGPPPEEPRPMAEPAVCRPPAAGEEGLAAALQRLVPPEYAERLLAARGPGGAEQRMVSILVASLSGLATSTRHLDPEETLELLDEFTTLLAAPVFRHEGTLVHLAGDTVMAFFGAPIAHENDPERACRAALEVAAAAQAYTGRLAGERGLGNLAVQVGLSTGLVIVGAVESDLRLEYTAVGDAVNLAVCMQQNAPPGGVLVAPETYRYVNHLFELPAGRAAQGARSRPAAGSRPPPGAAGGH